MGSTFGSTFGRKLGSPQPSTIRIFLVDDHALFLGGLMRLLNDQSDFEVVGFAQNLAHARIQIQQLRPELVLLDVDLGADRALDFLREPGGDSPFHVLIVTAGVSELEAMQLVHAGARGIFHKHHAPDSLCAAVRRIAAGDVVLEHEYLKGLFAAVDPQMIDGRVRLAHREGSVLRGLLQGLGNKEIAAEINLSESSVKAILRGLFDKLGVRSRSQLVKVALDKYRDLL